MKSENYRLLEVLNRQIRYLQTKDKKDDFSQNISRSRKEITDKMQNKLDKKTKESKKRYNYTFKINLNIFHLSQRKKDKPQ